MKSAVIAASSSIVRKKFIARPAPLRHPDAGSMIAPPERGGKYMSAGARAKKRRAAPPPPPAAPWPRPRPAAPPPPPPPCRPRLGGRDGPEPVRFGDWERRGIAVDF